MSTRRVFGARRRCPSPTPTAFEADDFRSVVYAWPIGATAYGYHDPAGRATAATAVDARGDLYVLTGNAQIGWVFQPGATTPSSVITKGDAGATAIAVDSRWNLYAGGASTVTVYKAGATKPMETITQGVGGARRPCHRRARTAVRRQPGHDRHHRVHIRHDDADGDDRARAAAGGSVADRARRNALRQSGYGAGRHRIRCKGGTTLSRKVSIPACCNGNIVVDPNDTLYAVGALASNSRELRIYTVPSQSKQWKTHLRSNHAYDLAIGPAW